MRTGNFRQYSLSQRFPITEVFYENILRMGADITTNEFRIYLTDHRNLFESLRWVINELSAYNANGAPVTECVDEKGKAITLDSSKLHPDLKEALTIEWPSLDADVSAPETWEMEYDTYGSCITQNEEVYFWETMRLFGIHYVVPILTKANIHPGGTHKIENILAVLTNHFRRSVYIQCVKLPNHDIQYLLELRICFDKTYKVENCLFQEKEDHIHKCVTTKSVNIPIVPGEFEND